MIKVLLLLMLLLAAYGLAVVLLRRLTQTTNELANLRDQMARNDNRLSDQMIELKRQQARRDAQEAAQNPQPKPEEDS